MYRVQRRGAMDRPTHNSLQYLTRVKPHHIQREPWLVDQYAFDALLDLLQSDVVDEFGAYTRSFYTLEGHYSNLWNYDQKIVPKPDDPVLKEAIRLASRAFRLPYPVTSINWTALKTVPFISTSSAGWGYVGKKGENDNHERAINKVVSSLNWWIEGQEGTNTPFLYRPDLAWTRTQMGTFEGPKIRHVWGEAFENVILEGMSAAPLIEAYQIKGEPMTIGLHLYKRLPSIINRALSTADEQRIAVGLDIKSFDSTVQPWLIRECFSIIRENLRFPGYMEEKAFEYSIEHFIRRPVVMPDGRMWLKQMGVPSGSYYTQLVDSIANLIAVYYAQLKIYERTFETWVLGDDSIFGIPLDLPHPILEEFATHLHTLGFTLSTTKCEIATRADQMVYLGHSARGTRVSRDTADMMRLALYPETPVTGPAMSIARIKGLFSNN
ncbi:hypothetical protein RN001_003748 [Aquatica leii]|uniref:RdRp catalytic domain-containing protein n=1 Tax=Aquatica leii TaxID=1421715 RepID=A0AAN7SKZ5_9COLE|nr:hypothetical protein RN001_003748 [Aquatica leii]